MSTANPVPPARRSLGRGGAVALPGQAAGESTGESSGADAAEPVEAGAGAEDEVGADGAAAAGAETAVEEPVVEEPVAGDEPVAESVPEPAGEPAAGSDEPAPGSGGDQAAVGVDGQSSGSDDGQAVAGTDAQAVAGADGQPAAGTDQQPAAGTDEQPAEYNGFAVRLDNFEGPFDLLLNLIAKHKLDVTEVSLSKVTDEFIAYIRAQGSDWDLGVATEFLVVAATLLDLKAARLLPAAEIEDEEDLALLEARDLLFARLLQYRAYKEIAAIFDDRWARESRRYPRDVPLEERYTGMLPELVIKMDLDKFARLAARAMTPKGPKIVSIEHIHVQRVSVREQSAIVVERLRRHGALTFRALTADCPDNLHVIARFLCLLELFREAAVGFEQVEALGELHVRWTGGDEDAPEVGAEFDEQDGGAVATDGDAATGDADEEADADADGAPDENDEAQVEEPV